MSIYDTLNPMQREAVFFDKGPLLILAGAGSGKTRVLTHRIAYLIEEQGVSPFQILAITFTNKAAKEMRERVDKIVSYGAENIWVSTFHSTCVRILRRFIESLGYSRNFTIYDSDDQKTLVRDICKSLNIDTKNVKERTFLSAISSAKDELISPEEYAMRANMDFSKKNFSRVYTEYQKRLKASNALDFDDLIMKTVELFQTNPEVLDYYRRRFRYIMVDEYQDTNTAQFRLISLLANYTNEEGEPEQNLCVVGDDDQSIYKFRGANIQNILNFEKIYPNAHVIRLEQNYRSTGNILSAANEVIHHNIGRKDKSLWTENEEGSPVFFTQYPTDYAEAEGVAQSIRDYADEKSAAYKDFAILYRTNAQSRVFEEKLIARNIPYRVIGSINFYQRKEIKDLLAYLKTIDNALDNLAVKRIINVPKRGIGLTTVDRIDDYAEANGMTFYEALRHAEFIPSVARACGKLTSFVAFIEALRSKPIGQSYTLKNLIEEIMEGTGLTEEIKSSAADEEEAAERLANVDELINKAVLYEQTADEPTLSGFLEEVALVADIDTLDESTDVTVLMTLHAAKGLEFPYVYLCGMEDGLFPSYASINADNPTEEIEEERRLCYVGITRAKKELHLSAASARMARGETQYNPTSRFIKEIPRYLLKMEQAGSQNTFRNNAFGGSPIRTMSGGSMPVPRKSVTYSNAAGDFDFEKPKPRPSAMPYASTPAAPAKNFGAGPAGSLDYAVGDKVRHIKFGAGTVTNIVSGGRDYEVTVLFDTYGVKKLLASFANLKKC
ncbi:MAG: UvrD-helicase domain-containing protein [Lachnospiraceae bacterium]|nr:UvrD-helicase domain-containing protein [Lachnospiraceae bacterium]